MDYNIRTLKSLRRRKAKLAKEIANCEAEIVDNFYQITHPFSNLSDSAYCDDDMMGGNFRFEEEYEEESPFVYKIYKTVKNVKKLSEIIKLGRSIYLDYRK